MKFAAAIVAAIISIAIGVGVGFFLLIALNGFSGRAADSALLFYAVWSLFIAVLAGLVALAGSSYLERTSIGKVSALLLPLIAALIASGIANVVGAFISALIADSLWRK
jgi:hypothetical protein